MNRDDERLAQLLATLVDQVHGLVTGDDWQAFLTQARRFHRYSPNNQCLLAAQLAERGVDPTAGGLVASYKTWTDTSSAELDNTRDTDTTSATELPTGN